MSDDLDIRDGGIVAVDTDALYDVAAAYRSQVQGLHEAVTAADTLLSNLGLLHMVWMHGASDRLSSAKALMADCADRLESVAHSLSMLAAQYEVVETRARGGFSGAPGAAGREAAELFAIENAHPGAIDGADRLYSAWLKKPADELADGFSTDAYIGTGIVLPFFPLLGTAMAEGSLVAPWGLQGVHDLTRTLDWNMVEPGHRAVGEAAAATVRQVGERSSVTPPTDLSEAVGRIPDSGRVRVETYTMPDGSEQYAVYLAGTRDFSLTAGEDPWDMTSNLRLYAGRNATSLAAVREALREAGVPHGAPVTLVGHSQGGMLADELAAGGDYDARMLVTAGSPTQARVGPGTLSVELRNTDDAVQFLAAGGSPVQVGAAGSVVIEGVGDPAPGRQDLSLAPHHLPRYAALAAAAEASGDPRMAKAKSLMDDLGKARSVSAVEYDATRQLPEKQPARPSPRPYPTPPPGLMPGSTSGGR